MMNLDNEPGCWPSGITSEGNDLTNSAMVNNPLLTGHSFEPPSIGVTESINSNDGKFNGAKENRKPFVGMEFDTIEASHVFWEKYARDTGFRARIRSSKKKRDGVIQTRTYVCAKEGTSPDEPRQVNPNRRCGCGTIMIVCLVKGKGIYRVTTFVEEHNHVLDVRVNNSLNLPSVRKPIVGMEFDTLEASVMFWEQYARNVGFHGRIRSSKRDKNGVVRSRKYVCSREGKKCDNSCSVNSDNSLDMRCGCGVLMTISLVKEKGTYRVVTFIEEHNHGFDVARRIPRRKALGQYIGVSQRRKTVVETSLPNSTKTRELDGEQNTSLEGPPYNLTNAQRMGILCTEFMQLAYRAVGSDEVFKGVRRLIKDGHLLADNYYMSKGIGERC